MVEFVQVLRALHIIGAILWGGAAFYRSHVVGKMLEDDVAATRFFATAPHGAYMGITATVTVVVGLALMGLNSEAYSLDVIGNGAWVLGLGMGAAMVAYGIGVFGHVPTDKRLRPLAGTRAEGGDHDEASYAGLVAKEHKLGRVSTALIGAALLLMVTFRWF